MEEVVVKGKKLQVETSKGTVYEFGGGDKPGANSVGSAEIENDSVQEEDLHPDVREKLNAMNDSEDVTEEEIEDCVMDALRANGLEELITQEAGAAEGEVSGDGPELD